MNGTPQNPLEEDAMERAVTAALEQPRTAAVPLDFAARVSVRAAALPKPARKPQANYARSVMVLLGTLLLIASFVIAPHAEPTFSNMVFDIELTLVALLAAIGYALTRARKESL